MSSSAESPSDLTIPAPLQAQIRAMAAVAHRPAAEIVRDALERYLSNQQADLRAVPDAPRRAESAIRMRERRIGRVLPPGMTFEGMIADGRA